MGTRSAEQIEREIEELRVDTDRVLVEIESRFREALDVRTQVERHPLAVGSAGLAILGAFGLTAYTVYTRVTHKHSVLDRVKQQLEHKRAPGSFLAREKPGAPRGIGVGLVKRILWAFMATVLVTLASFAARKFSATLWTRTMHEKPPTK